jgi:hypothetical protein
MSPGIVHPVPWWTTGLHHSEYAMDTRTKTTATTIGHRRRRRCSVSHVGERGTTGPDDGTTIDRA